MKMNKTLFFIVASMLSVPALAGWQYGGYYIDDGYYQDDGSRFIMGGYGGLSFVNAKIKNEVGSLQTDYYKDSVSGIVISGAAYDMLDASQQAYYTPIGVGDISELPAAKNLSKNVFTAGGYVGFSMPNHPQWRILGGYDHISEINYDRIPLFEGDISLTSGEGVHVYSSGIKSTLTTDIVSVTVIYDFFEGSKKPLNTFIPYLGVGAGYAMSKTTLKVTDIFGDLSYDSDLNNYYGSIVNGILVFDNPSDVTKYPTSDNVAVFGTLGASYGINEYTYIDFGARLMYIPKITWAIANEAGTQHRNWFSAENTLYTNLTVGLRFEF